MDGVGIAEGASDASGKVIGAVELLDCGEWWGRDCGKNPGMSLTDPASRIGGGSMAGDLHALLVSPQTKNSASLPDYAGGRFHKIYVSNAVVLVKWIVLWPSECLYTVAAASMLTSWLPWLSIEEVISFHI